MLDKSSSILTYPPSIAHAPAKHECAPLDILQTTWLYIPIIFYIKTREGVTWAHYHANWIICLYFDLTFGFTGRIWRFPGGQEDQMSTIT